jgi:hypothetical protein
MWYSHTTECNSTHRKELLKNATIWMTLKIMLSERHHTNLMFYHSLYMKCSPGGKSIDKTNRLAVSWSQG